MTNLRETLEYTNLNWRIGHQYTYKMEQSEKDTSKKQTLQIISMKRKTRTSAESLKEKVNKDKSEKE